MVPPPFNLPYVLPKLLLHYVAGACSACCSSGRADVAPEEEVDKNSIKYKEEVDRNSAVVMCSKLVVAAAVRRVLLEWAYRRGARRVRSKWAILDYSTLC